MAKQLPVILLYRHEFLGTFWGVQYHFFFQTVLKGFSIFSFSEHGLKGDSLLRIPKEVRPSGEQQMLPCNNYKSSSGHGCILTSYNFYILLNLQCSYYLLYLHSQYLSTSLSVLYNKYQSSVVIICYYLCLLNGNKIAPRRLEVVKITMFNEGSSCVVHFLFRKPVFYSLASMHHNMT